MRNSCYLPTIPAIDRGRVLPLTKRSAISETTSTAMGSSFRASPGHRMSITRRDRPSQRLSTAHPDVLVMGSKRCTSLYIGSSRTLTRLLTGHFPLLWLGHFPHASIRTDVQAFNSRVPLAGQFSQAADRNIPQYMAIVTISSLLQMRVTWAKAPGEWDPERMEGGNLNTSNHAWQQGSFHGSTMRAQIEATFCRKIFPVH